MMDIAKRSGLPWDAILGAEVVRAYKPTPEAYLRTAEVLMMKPEQPCLVAAHNSDLAAARKCGFRAAFIPRPFEHGPEQTSDLHPEQDWDHVAGDLDRKVHPGRNLRRSAASRIVPNVVRICFTVRHDKRLRLRESKL